MGSVTRPSPGRLETILHRQDPPAWGPGYTPSMLATREEAPSASRPSAIASRKLGRALHAMSSPERDLLIYALFHPKVFDIHEQRMLSCTPRQHPLQDHPEFGSSGRPFMRGTVEVAESLGVLDLHPTVTWRFPEHPTRSPMKVPFPFIGDLLIFFHGSAGPAAVNWTVKARAEDFDRPVFGSRKHKASKKSAAEEKLRHEIESIYYADAEISTIRLTANDWEESLKANLRQLFLWHDRPVSIKDEKRRHIVSQMISAVGTDATPLDIAILVGARTELSIDEVKAIMYQAIWKRELRVNLFEAFMMDKPMLPEIEDPIVKYSQWLK